MIIVLRPNSTDEQVNHILERIAELGLKPHVSRGEQRTIIGVIGDEHKLRAEPLSAIPGVEQVLPILKPFKLASREFQQADTVVQVGAVRIGGGDVVRPQTVHGDHQQQRRRGRLGRGRLRGEQAAQRHDEGHVAQAGVQGSHDGDRIHWRDVLDAFSSGG